MILAKHLSPFFLGLLLFAGLTFSKSQSRAQITGDGRPYMSEDVREFAANEWHRFISTRPTDAEMTELLIKDSVLRDYMSELAQLSSWDYEDIAKSLAREQRTVEYIMRYKDTWVHRMGRARCEAVFTN